MVVPTSVRPIWPHGEKRKLVILGSTGSIGQSALSVVRAHPERFEIVALGAGKNVEALSRQIQEFSPKVVSVSSSAAQTAVHERFPTLEVLVGEAGMREIAALSEADLVLAAVVGMAGLDGVLAALSAGKNVALANKESLVAGGELVRRICKEQGTSILPVDSEHSALFQALQGEHPSDIRSLIITASGGPFLRIPREKLSLITPQQAVQHPRWNMGAKISVDSATLVNKALEVIEASWLFSLPEDRIEVVVHPESIVHSLVEFSDGSQIAQLSVPDMCGAIAYALSHPYGRLSNVMPRLRLAEISALHFEKPDTQRFPALNLARSALQQGGTAPALFNLANEVAVSRFLAQTLRFDMIIDVIQCCMESIPTTAYSSLEELKQLAVRVDEVVGSRFN